MLGKTGSGIERGGCDVLSTVPDAAALVADSSRPAGIAAVVVTGTDQW